MSWICPKCERELISEKQSHYCVKITVDELFAGKKPELVLVFDRILAEVAEWPDVLVSTTPNCIVFVHRQTFLVLKPMTKALDVKFYSAAPLEIAQIYKSGLYAKKYFNQIRLTHPGEVSSQLFMLIRDSYQLL